MQAPPPPPPVAPPAANPLALAQAQPQAAPKTIAALYALLMSHQAGTISRAQYDTDVAQLKADVEKAVAAGKTDAVEVAAAAKTQTEANVLAGLLETLEEALADLPGADELATQPKTIPEAVQAIAELTSKVYLDAGLKSAKEAMSGELQTVKDSVTALEVSTTASLELCAKVVDLQRVEDLIKTRATTTEVSHLREKVAVLEKETKDFIKAPALTAMEASTTASLEECAKVSALTALEGKVEGWATVAAVGACAKATDVTVLGGRVTELEEDLKKDKEAAAARKEEFNKMTDSLVAIKASLAKLTREIEGVKKAGEQGGVGGGVCLNARELKRVGELVDCHAEGLQTAAGDMENLRGEIEVCREQIVRFDDEQIQGFGKTLEGLKADMDHAHEWLDALAEREEGEGTGLLGRAHWLVQERGDLRRDLESLTTAHNETVEMLHRQKN